MGPIADLQAEAKARGLWVLGHPKEIGGGGLPFMDFVYLNEIIGRSTYGPVAAGTATMQDSIMLHLYASDDQRERYLAPLVASQETKRLGAAHEIARERRPARLPAADAVAVREEIEVSTLPGDVAAETSGG